MTTFWVSAINIGLGSIFAFAGSYVGSYMASRKATIEAEKEIGNA